MSEGRIGSSKHAQSAWRVYPRPRGAATECRARFGLEKASRHAYLGRMTVHFPFQNTYAALPANFFARVAPTPVASPQLIKLNRPLAVHLGLVPALLSTPQVSTLLAATII